MIGFLIINYNDAPTTITLLKNVKDYSCLDYIVVIDNNSTDDSYSKLLPYANEKVHILRRDDGRAFGAGINFGLKYLESFGVDYSFISNSDVVIYSESDLKKLISYRNGIHLLGPVIKEHTGLNRGWKIPSNGLLFLQSLPFVYRFFQNNNRYSESFYSQKLLEVEAVSFCFFFASLKSIREVGYFDEKVFLYFEENIMSSKFQKKGIYLCTNVEVFHNHSVTINKNLNRVAKYQTLSNSRRYFSKVYNHAGPITLFGFWFVEKMTIFFLHISRILHKN